MKSFCNKKPYDYYEELEKLEIDIYNQLYFDSSSINSVEKINYNTLKEKTINVFEDYDYNQPQNIFIIKNFEGKIIVGRKIRSVLRIENKINAINCSMITAPMILGVLVKRAKTNRKIRIEYYPFSDSEKKYVFDKIKNDRTFDIYYPYKYRDFYTEKEENSPETGWSFNPDKKEYLGYGEVHLRNFTTTYFKNKSLDNKIVYDPACSTGEFLNEFKSYHKNCYTIGHDLSKEMIDYAKDYVDEALCCNAIDSPLKDNSVDIMFLRFLNSEVVTTRLAYRIMKKLLSKMKKGSLIVCFGHTPVLITKEWFEKNGLKSIICNGYDEERNAIFQYYVFEVQ
ncbi:MAG: methyltransferase domain-containing protein [bacterium]|nr:methyltransferase domain-containing protein [bacterium]